MGRELPGKKVTGPNMTPTSVIARVTAFDCSTKESWPRIRADGQCVTRLIFRAQSMSGRNVLSNGREATHFPHEVIVGVVVVDRGHLTHDGYTRTWLCPEFVQQVRSQRNGTTGREPEYVTRLDAM